ncbi:Odorant receptor 88 [Blattella germanica]|nr:Odorant receptor 88 [Blattella germanica]
MEVSSRTKSRFDLYIFLLRAAGIPFFMKQKSFLFLAYELFMYASTIITLVSTWICVLEGKQDIKVNMATLRVSMGALVIIPFNFCFRFQMKDFEQLTKMTELFTWEELPTKDPDSGEITSAGLVAPLRKLVKYSFIGGITGHTFQCLYRIIWNHELIFVIWSPYDWQVSPAYEITNVMQMAGSLMVFCSLCGYLGLYCTLVAVACSQFDKLKMNMLQVYHGEEETRDKRLNACIKHHQLVLQFLDDMENALTAGMCIALLVLMTALCVIAFSAVTSVGDPIDMIQIIMLYIIWMSAICIICWFGNELTDKADSVREAAYDGEWIGKPISFQRSLLIIMTRCNKSFNLTAGKFVLLNNETMMNILKETLSLFMFLLEMKDKSIEEGM